MRHPAGEEGMGPYIESGAASVQWCEFEPWNVHSVKYGITVVEKCGNCRSWKIG